MKKSYLAYTISSLELYETHQTHYLSSKKIQISLIEKGAYFLTEAIIIIVSITISLWVNNWSEDNKNEEIAQNFLKSISRDLTHDLLEMKEDSASISRQLQCATFIRTLVIPKLPKIV
jgi:Fe2+ transport system protein B